MNGGKVLPSAPRHSAFEIWEATLSQLVLRVTRQNYENWLRQTVGTRFDGTTLIVSTPSELGRDWLSTRMRNVVGQALTAVAGPGLDISFEALIEAAASPRPGVAVQPTMVPNQSSPPNPRFRFDSFLSFEHNRMAMTAALDVAHHADSPYSPLFITGPSGCGKTHLLHAIAHQAAAAGIRFVLATADQFVSDFTGAVRARTGPAFRARYRDIDLLLIDDVHILVGKKATIAEFFQTVASLHDHGRRVVLAGDHNALMCEAAARFDTPLRWGLVAAIEAPDMGDRVQFLEARASCSGVQLEPQVIHYIALRVKSSLRDLEGALNRVLAHARISREPLTIDLAARALQPPSATPLMGVPGPQPAEVITAVSTHLSLAPEALRGARRDRASTYARHLVMYLLRQDGALTYSGIAVLLNKKDHSTVVHACSQIESELKVSPELRADIDAIRAALHGSSPAA